MTPKFRAWLKKQNAMCDVNAIGFSTDQVSLTHRGVFGWSQFATLEEVELLLSTGLKDKNGKEVYEGDIICKNLRPFRDTNIYGEIVYDSISGFTILWGGSTPNTVDFVDEVEKSEVIGNIYENKELLK